MADFLSRLHYKFRQQQEFARGYSPLYACLFGVVADWLAGRTADPLVAWLLAAGQGRSSLDVTLLLAAGLHRHILSGVAEVRPLAAYYPTAGGRLPCHTPDFALTLRQAILARQESLAAFIQATSVQTNETARGLAWLLPLLFTPWPAVHLVDLGASAGLNLAADQRAYRLLAATDGRLLLDLGHAPSPQFLVHCHPPVTSYQLPVASHHLPVTSDQSPVTSYQLPITSHQLPATNHLPSIASRTGCDVAPFALHTAGDEQTLSAFIWGDQPQRLERLREGIAAFHRVNQGPAPVRLYKADLPADLLPFLDQHVPAQPPLPVVIYNTYITVYLPDKGGALRHHIARWAATQGRPILWLQWEPLRNAKPPQLGWCAWTADLWSGNNHHQWQLGWVHPHGTHVQWEPDFQAWRDFW
jgi:hypothetical protein